MIVVSEHTEQPDLLRAFEAGADDSSPAQPHIWSYESPATLLRRSDMRQSERRAEPLGIGPLTINTVNYAAILRGNRLALRSLEFELLLYLASDPQRVFRKQELLSAIWGYRPTATTRTLDSHTSRLRCKLRATGEHWIVNVEGSATG